jgi:hypothetical protein
MQSTTSSNKTSNNYIPNIIDEYFLLPSTSNSIYPCYVKYAILIPKTLSPSLEFSKKNNSKNEKNQNDVAVQFIYILLVKKIQNSDFNFS